MTESTIRGNRPERGFPPVPEPLPGPVPDVHTHLDLTIGVRAASPGGTAGTGSTGTTGTAGTSGTAGTAGAAGPGLVGPAPGGAVGGIDSVETALALAACSGVDRIVQIGVDLASARLSVDLAGRHPAIVAAVALHPNEAPRLAAEGSLEPALGEIATLAADPRVRGIGETGLDHYRTGESGRPAQDESFRAHIEIAKASGKALVIHDREAHAAVLRVLDQAGAPETVVMHCFSGDAGFAEECLRRGFFLSFAGNVTFRNATDLRKALLATPLDRLLVETDAPFLTPVPYRGRPNASYLVPITVRAIAELLETPVPDLCERLSTNAERVFGPWR